MGEIASFGYEDEDERIVYTTEDGSLTQLETECLSVVLQCGEVKEQRAIDAKIELEQYREQLIGRLLLTYGKLVDQYEHDSKAWNALSPLLYDLQRVERLRSISETTE